MKAVRLGLLGRRFDDQYTFDLQGYLSVHDFNSAMSLFNEAVRRHPPPSHKAIWAGTLLTLWVIVAGTVYILWNFLLLKENPYILLIVPSIMLLTAILWVWRYRYLHSTFQRSLVELCSRINASENIRGVNYRLTKHGLDVQHHAYDRDSVVAGSRSNTTSTYGGKARYALVIEFDDRYRALRSQQQQALQPPEFVFCPQPASAAYQLYSSPLAFGSSTIPPPPLDEKMRSPSWTATYHHHDNSFKTNSGLTNTWVDSEKHK